MKLPAMAVTSKANLRYLSGFADEGAILLVTTKGMTLFVSPLEYGMAEAAVRKGVNVKTIETLEKTFASIKKCGFEENDITVGRLKRWKKVFPKTSFVPVTGVIEEYRRSKDQEELKYLKRALKITDMIIESIPGFLQEGITEKEVAWQIETWAQEFGAEGMSFPSIVGFGLHTSRPHHRPTDKKLKKRDIIQIDIGAVYKGYCGDRSEVFFAGEPTEEQFRVYKAVEEAKNVTKFMAVEGASTQVLDQTAIDILKKYKLHAYFTHTLGHGVGVEVHEGVYLSHKRRAQKLLRNEVVTIEPGVYIPGKFGIRLEDMVFVR
jgi:Xaa-Pro aminopeptidase